MKEKDHHAPWQVLASRTVYSGLPWFEVIQQRVCLSDGQVVEDFHQIQMPDYAMTYAETADGRVILERQYKHGVGRVNLTFPCGTIFTGEDPLVAAQRELLEETGYQAAHCELIGKFVVQANYGSGHATFFHATGARPVAEPRSGDLEHIEVVLLTKDEIRAAIKSGEIITLDSAALAALMLLK